METAGFKVGGAFTRKQEFGVLQDLSFSTSGGFVSVSFYCRYADGAVVYTGQECQKRIGCRADPVSGVAIFYKIFIEFLYSKMQK